MSSPLTGIPMRNHDGTAMLTHDGTVLYRSQYLSTHPLRSDCQERIGYGNQRLTYVTGDGVIRTMNQAFGVGGWGTEIRMERLVRCEKDEQGRWAVGYLATVRITLQDGQAHEDIGSGEGVNESRTKAHEIAIKSAVTDAMKRAARHYGERLGNALYIKGNGLHTAPKDNQAAIEELKKKESLNLFGNQSELRQATTAESSAGISTACNTTPGKEETLGVQAKGGNEPSMKQMSVRASPDGQGQLSTSKPSLMVPKVAQAMLSTDNTSRTRPTPTVNTVTPLTSTKFVPPETIRNDDKPHVPEGVVRIASKFVPPEQSNDENDKSRVATGVVGVNNELNNFRQTSGASLQISTQPEKLQATTPPPLPRYTPLDHEPMSSNMDNSAATVATKRSSESTPIATRSKRYKTSVNPYKR